MRDGRPDARQFLFLARSDGALLARFPPDSLSARQLSPESMFSVAIGKGAENGLYSVSSEIDGVSRRMGFRKLEGFPVYAIAGIETSAIQGEWLSAVGSYLMFGLPASLLLFGVLWVALKRTERLL